MDVLSEIRKLLGKRKEKKKKHAGWKPLVVLGLVTQSKRVHSSREKRVSVFEVFKGDCGIRWGVRSVVRSQITKKQEKKRKRAA